MTALHPADENGDWLPALKAPETLTGSPALALLALHRLRLLQGDWWETPDQGSRILSLLRDRRTDEAGLREVADALSDDLASLPGVLAVQNANAVPDGRRIVFTCTLVSEDGNTTVETEIG